MDEALDGLDRLTQTVDWQARYKAAGLTEDEFWRRTLERARERGRAPYRALGLSEKQADRLQDVEWEAEGAEILAQTVVARALRRDLRRRIAVAVAVRAAVRV